jgi:GNAT superfamily N-acetyltransferase
MALVLDALVEPASVPGLQITRVLDPDTLRVWGQTFGVGYELPSQIAEHFVALMACGGRDSLMHHYLADHGSTPIAAASLWLAAGVAGIYNVATVPDARRQGIGATQTAAALRDARAMGYRAAILQPSEMGFPVYQRLGFRQLCTMEHHFWVRQSL